jgi:hypothetical protein
MEAAAMQIERGSGNVFADIGVSRPDEALAKANLVMTIERILNDRRLTRAKAAAILAKTLAKRRRCLPLARRAVAPEGSSPRGLIGINRVRAAHHLVIHPGERLRGDWLIR